MPTRPPTRQGTEVNRNQAHAKICLILSDRPADYRVRDMADDIVDAIWPPNPWQAITHSGEERLCYHCRTVDHKRRMQKITIGEVELWWCDDASWCRSRA